MDKNEQLKTVFQALCELTLRITDKNNTTGYGLNILPAVIENIISLSNVIR